MAGVLQQAITAGDLPIDAGDVPGLLEQVRETADSKFGDYTTTVAMPLAKRVREKPRTLAERLISQIGRAHV